MFIEIGDFLNLRLKQMGILHLFGVPGDFNLSYLEQVEADSQLEFIGNCNELNAAYAADGYARINGFAALTTTYGVGDLSAINGIAGAYAENVPVVHISGIPPLHVVQKGTLVHHTLVDGNYDNIMNCMKEFTVAQTRLTPANAAFEIDRVLRQCFLDRRPVHIQLPSDITHVKIEVTDRPLDLSYPAVEPELLQSAVAKLCEVIGSAKNPALLIDNEASVFGVTSLLNDLSQKCSIPFASMLTAKNIMDEGSPRYVGTYVGGASQPNVRSTIEQSDCLIGVGVRFSDVGTGVFTHQIATENYIEIKPYALTIFGQDYPGIEIGQLLVELNKKVAPRKLIKPILEKQQPQVIDVPEQQKLSQDILWSAVADFLKEDDVIIGEVGTSNSALAGLKLPATAKYIAQPLWGSIGYTLPALLGSLLAAPERRQILFIGDGSFQLTVQELSTIIRHGLKPIIFLLNNGGYTIERLIMGENAAYNDIQNWHYTEIPGVFNCKHQYKSCVVETAGQLKQILDTMHQFDGLTFIELKLPAMDAPLSLKKFASVIARFDYGDRGYEILKQRSQMIPYQKVISF
ncbi:alpha-keto acid decarboxylase family protein [Acinetobacter vivianii]|uniref:alpha-keto acid decarboxylase family protein n=1 Tax=Acinetobacter vivianii TaxID=1776742 RepID=UPI002DB6027A|nr:thiamine pyrophosphate-binding protein [Acinetobacter vivianii]MEB6480483.1 thiamine pyrophosphate-binding protein [Acinetobacter vivianii]MEB6656484.1 thiamine pyrophosphate-binding protein [Acinetobacter vivianii]